MAVKTLGTTANNSLNPAVAFSPSPVTLLPADMASTQQAILDDINVAHPVWPGAFSYNGLLYVPNRGVLKVLPGDWVGVDSQGWPILVSANSIAHAAWTHT
jgi:hypothetical protein